VAEVQIAVRLGRKARPDRLVGVLREVGLDDLTNEVGAGHPAEKAGVSEILAGVNISPERRAGVHSRERAQGGLMDSGSRECTQPGRCSPLAAYLASARGSRSFPYRPSRLPKSSSTPSM